MTSRPEKKLKEHFMLNIQKKITSPKKTKEHEMRKSPQIRVQQKTHEFPNSSLRNCRSNWDGNDRLHSFPNYDLPGCSNGEPYNVGLDSPQ